eukprot:7609877-Pyramimonas_sp.AAC.2
MDLDTPASSVQLRYAYSADGKTVLECVAVIPTHTRHNKNKPYLLRQVAISFAELTQLLHCVHLTRLHIPAEQKYSTYTPIRFFICTTRDAIQFLGVHSPVSNVAART